MKKVLMLFVGALLCVSLVGCSSYRESPKKEQASVEEKSNVTSSTQEKELVFGLNETAAFSNLKFTATELKESEGDSNGYFTPEDGHVFVGIKFTVENVSDEEQTISSILLFDGYVDDVKCEYSLNAQIAFDEGTIDGAVAAGKKLVGWYALEVPQDWSVIELDVKNNWLSSQKPAKFVFSK